MRDDNVRAEPSRVRNECAADPCLVDSNAHTVIDAEPVHLRDPEKCGRGLCLCPARERNLLLFAVVEGRRVVASPPGIAAKIMDAQLLTNTKERTAFVRSSVA